MIAGAIMNFSNAAPPIKRHVASVIFILALGFVIYANTLGNGYVPGDRAAVENNGFLASWGNLRYFLDPVKYFTASGEMMFRPMTTLSYFIDHMFWGYDPAGYHLTNLLIHSVNAVLLYFILVFMLDALEGGRSAEGVKGAGGLLYPPLVTALLFTAHPAQSGAVDFIGGRHDILMTFFYLWAIFFYQRAVFRKPAVDARYFALSLAMFVFSCLSKETGITLPAVIVLIDVLSSPDRGETLFWKKRAPLYAAFAAVAAVIIFMKPVMSAGCYDPGSGGCLLIWGALVGYLKLLVFPRSFGPECVTGGWTDRAPVSFADPSVLIPAILLLSLTVFVIMNRKKYPMFLLGSAWFFVTLLPVFNMFSRGVTSGISEQCIYLPAAGFCVVLAFGLLRLGEKGANGPRAEIMTRAAMVLAALLVCYYSVRTHERNIDWKNGVSLWTAAAEACPDSYMAYYNLGMSYQYERGDAEKAIEAFKGSLKDRDLPRTHAALGLAYIQKGRYAEALAELETAQREEPSMGTVYHYLGLLYVATGEFDKAIDIGRKGLAVGSAARLFGREPVTAGIHDMLGKAYAGKKEYDGAIGEFNISLDLRPGDAEVLFSLGKVYALKARNNDAAEVFKTALRTAPRNVPVRYALANAYLKLKLYDKAEKEYFEILKRDPAHADARNNLANLYYSRGMVAKAVAEYLKVLEMDPSHFRARNNIANIYLVSAQFDKAIAEYKRVIEAQPANAPAHYNLGLAYDGKGMSADAEREWKEALKADPMFRQAAEAMRKVAQRNKKEK